MRAALDGNASAGDLEGFEIREEVARAISRMEHHIPPCVVVRRHLSKVHLQHKSQVVDFSVFWVGACVECLQVGNTYMQ